MHDNPRVTRVAMIETCSRCRHRMVPSGGVSLCSKNSVNFLRNVDIGVCPVGLFTGEPSETVPSSEPVPRSKWSLAARLIEKLAMPGDKGIGDTLERFLRGKGGDAYKRWFKRITGGECGCGDRRKRLNAAHPY